ILLEASIATPMGPWRVIPKSPKLIPVQLPLVHPAISSLGLPAPPVSVLAIQRFPIESIAMSVGASKTLPGLVLELLKLVAVLPLLLNSVTLPFRSAPPKKLVIQALPGVSSATPYGSRRLPLVKLPASVPLDVNLVTLLPLKFVIHAAPVASIAIERGA